MCLAGTELLERAATGAVEAAKAAGTVARSPWTKYGPIGVGIGLGLKILDGGSVAVDPTWKKNQEKIRRPNPGPSPTPSPTPSPSPSPLPLPDPTPQDDPNCEKEKEKKKCKDPIPTYIENGAKFPDHVRLVDTAQRIGYPKILTRGPGGNFSNKNRNTEQRKFKDSFSSENSFRASELGWQADEYPYASTYENQNGAYFDFVPSKENEDAGLDLLAFLTAQVKKGCKFKVQVINAR
jgi:hypothetical protein